MRELIGLKIVAIKGNCIKYGYDGKALKDKKKSIEPEYIFFDDLETILELSEQDHYSYHDFSSSARQLTIRKDKAFYTQLINSDSLKDSNQDL